MNKVDQPVLSQTNNSGEQTAEPPAQTAPTSPAVESSTPPAVKEDVVLVCGTLKDQDGLAVIRKRDDRIEPGAVLPLKAGQPIHGEVVRLIPRKESPLLCDVKVDYAPTETARPTSKGPGQIATEQYRKNWDAIWSKKNTTTGVLN